MTATRRSSSYGHAILSYRDPACPEWAKGQMACSMGIRCPGARVIPTALPRYTGEPLTVGGPATHYAFYRYVTGRAGRTTGRTLFLCDACAATFAKRHSLAIEQPNEATP